jgi:purine-cytosine permease-like protein
MTDVVEQYTIRPIPEDQRHGTARSLFPFWFTANSSAFTVVLGAVGIELGLGIVPASSRSSPAGLRRRVSVS